MGSSAKKTEKMAEKKIEKKTEKTVRRERTGLGNPGGFLMLAGMAALFGSVCGIIFLFTKAFFHSDSAYFVQLAVEQMKSGKLFPPGMCYSTALFVRTPNLLLIPLLAVIKDWMLAREIMVIEMWVILIASVFCLFLTKRDRNPVAAVIACMLLMNPYQTLDVANEIGEHTLDEFAGDVARGVSHVDGMLTVERWRGGSQLQRGGVLLVMQLQRLYLLRGLARAEYQHPRSQGVERTGMPGLHPLHMHLLRDKETDVGQGTKRRHAIGLVDVYECSFVEVH